MPANLVTGLHQSFFAIHKQSAISAPFAMSLVKMNQGVARVNLDSIASSYIEGEFCPPGGKATTTLGTLNFFRQRGSHTTSHRKTTNQIKLKGAWRQEGIRILAPV
jgi:hypothetical protein